MSIAVVAYEMEGERTGVGRYLEGLLWGIARTGDARRWRLYFKGDPFDHPLWATGDGRFEPVFDRRPQARPILWEQLRLPLLLRRDSPELVVFWFTLTVTVALFETAPLISEIV